VKYPVTLASWQADKDVVRGMRYVTHSAGLPEHSDSVIPEIQDPQHNCLLPAVRQHGLGIQASMAIEVRTAPGGQNVKPPST
jgi:hypothetical protein